MGQIVETDIENYQNIAAALREFHGQDKSWTPPQMADAILEISTDVNATENDILASKTALVNRKKVTGTIPSVEKAMPEITVNSSGWVTADVNQSNGYVTGDNKSGEHKLSQDDDINFTAENIRKGVTVFGIDGECDTLDEQEKHDSSDAVVNGPKVSFPGGYYPEQHEASVKTATHNAPTVSINKDKGLISASHSQKEGYVTANNPEKEDTKTATLQLPIQGDKTIIPSINEQTVVEKGKYITGDVKVAGLTEVEVDKANINVTINSDALVTATGHQNAGYVSEGDIKGTLQLTKRTALSASGNTVTAEPGYYPNKVTKDISTVEQATPTIKVYANGEIEAKVDQASGYVSGKEITVTHTLDVNDDRDFAKENIRYGKNIFGIDGEFTKASSSEAASASNIMSGKVAWVNGNKITGNIPTKTSLTVSGKTVTAEAGYYADKTQASVKDGSVSIPNVSLNPTVKINVSDSGEITATATANTSKTIQPTVSAGYVSTVSNATASVTVSATKQLDVKGSDDITVSSNGLVTAPGGYYPQSAKHILSSDDDENFVENNIANGVTIFGLTGKRPTLDGVPDRKDSDISVSGPTVSFPYGYYPQKTGKNVNYSKSVVTITHPSPTASIEESTGIVTASHTQGTGYVTGGTTTGTLNLKTQGKKTITPKTTSQTAVEAGRYTTGVITVDAMPTATMAIPSVQVTSDGNIIAKYNQKQGYVEGGEVSTENNPYKLSVKDDANFVKENIRDGKTIFGITGNCIAVQDITPRTDEDLKVTNNVVTVPDGYYGQEYTKTVGTAQGAAEYYPSASAQTIPSDLYLTGAQTIKGVTVKQKVRSTISDLVASSIKDGVTVLVGDETKNDRVKSISGTFTDSSTVTKGQTAATSAQILNGHSAWVDGAEVKGNIATQNQLGVSNNVVTANAGYYDKSVSATVGTAKTEATYYVDKEDRKIGSGYYLTGDQIIKGVTTNNISAANIKSGVTIQVGDDVNAGRIANVEGTFTRYDTVSKEQTAVKYDANYTSLQILNGYSAWVDGKEIKGTLTTNTQAKTVSPSTNSQDVVPDSDYIGLSKVTVNAMPSGSVTTPPTTISVTSPTITIDTTDGKIKVSGSKTQGITPTVTAGYVSSGTSGNVTASVSGEKNITIRSSSDMSITGSVVTAPSGYYPSDGEFTVNNNTQTLTVSPTTSRQDFTPGDDYIGFSQVTVNAANLQARTGITPTKSSQTISKTDQNAIGLSSVQINAIPDKYQDVSGVTATKDNVLSGFKFVDSSGFLLTGSMTNNGTISEIIDGIEKTSYTVPKGYHSGTGKVTFDDSKIVARLERI